MLSLASIVKNASRAGIAIPAFNVPYLPMVKPVIQAVVDQDSFALIETARIEWLRFECRGAAAVQQEFNRWQSPEHVRLHLDHIPVIDEAGLEVNYLPIIHEAIDLGYHSVMIDGSSCDLAGNITATQRAVALAHAAGIPCEAELGAIVREGGEPLLSYEELFKSGKGFTDVDDAVRFATETGCDWLSVAIGNIHGSISAILKDKTKTEARLNLELLERLRQEVGLPLVLHGGSGVNAEDMRAAIQRGIAKVNVGFEIRSAYEVSLRASGGDTSAAQAAVYDRTCWLIRDYFGIAGSRRLIAGVEA
jgi:ketose-bisphosphate aldolase